MKHRGCTSARVLVAIASRFYGLTLREIMDEVHLSRPSVYRLIRELENLGVQFDRRMEEIRGGWRLNYRVSAIRGHRFELKKRTC
jgi:DNA-binding IclR family transcriptional regulator